MRSRTSKWILGAACVLLYIVFGQAPAWAQSSPSISGLSYNSGGVGLVVYVSGSNFGSSQDSSTVTFNGTDADSNPF
jgi:hypothetical protein